MCHEPQGYDRERRNEEILVQLTPYSFYFCKAELMPRQLYQWKEEKVWRVQ